MHMNFKLFHIALIALLIQASPVWAVEAGKQLPDLGLAEVQKPRANTFTSTTGHRGVALVANLFLG